MADLEETCLGKRNGNSSDLGVKRGFDDIIKFDVPCLFFECRLRFIGLTHQAKQLLDYLSQQVFCCNVGSRN